MKLDIVDRLPDPLRESALSQRVVKGQRLFRKGDRANYLYLIKQGRFQEIGYSQNSQIGVLQILSMGEALGETALIEEVYRSTAIAKVDSQVIAYPIASLKTSLQQSPLVIEALVEILCQKISELQVRLEWRNISMADHRVLEYVKYKLEKLASEADADSPTLTLNTPLQEIAAELGFVPGTLSRALAKLEANQKILRESNRITLLNTDAA